MTSVPYNIEIKDIKGSGFPVKESVVEFTINDAKGKTSPTAGPDPKFDADLKYQTKGVIEKDTLWVTVYTPSETDNKKWEKFAAKSIPVMTLAEERKEKRKKEFSLILNPAGARKDARQNQGAEWGQRDTIVTFRVEWPTEEQVKKGSAKL
eukprot:TRINITY_DN278_c0_g1_i1.p1 TRINITY_DN278_c0_g1~~TRINITY_DN278_c0_g1_i1.p1  ORF type:complete len:151 (-),score=37.67 TRINITY_DN278_c0_g1_i1:85-537(-)